MSTSPNTSNPPQPQPHQAAAAAAPATTTTTAATPAKKYTMLCWVCGVDLGSNISEAALVQHTADTGHTAFRIQQQQ